MRSIGSTFLLLAICASVSRGAQVTISPSKDNTLYENSTGSLSNGAGQYVFSGRTSQLSGSIRRGLIRFDIAAAIPAGSTINSVTLTLHCSSSASGPENESLHRVLADWGEGSSMAGGAEGQGGAAATGDATWLHTFYPTSFWATPGGDSSGAASATTAVDQADLFYAWTSAQMTADVQSWLDQPATNFGWLLQGDESVGGTAKRFDSRQNLTSEFQPALTINFSFPRGDMNCDGQVNLADVPIFTSALLDPVGFIGCDVTRADCNGDGSIDGRDVAGFVSRLLSS